RYGSVTGVQTCALPIFQLCDAFDIPIVSHSDTIGMSKASQSWRKRAALSPASASIAPPRWRGLLAIRPNGLPSMRIKAVIMPTRSEERRGGEEGRLGVA